MWGGSGQQGTRKTQVEGLPLPRIFITKNKQKERKEKEKQKKMGRRGRKNTRKQTNKKSSGRRIQRDEGWMGAEKAMYSSL